MPHKGRFRRAACAAVCLLAVMAAWPVSAAGTLSGAQERAYMPQAAESLPTAPPPMPAQAPAAPRQAVPQPQAPSQGAAAQNAVAPQARQTGTPLLSLPDVDLSWKGYFEALAILCFVLVGFIALLWLLKRLARGKVLFSRSAPGPLLESRVSLGPKKWIMVVRYLNKRLLLGVTEQHITLLAELSLEEEVARGGAAAPGGGKANKADAGEGSDSADSFISLLNRNKESFPG